MPRTSSEEPSGKASGSARRQADPERKVNLRQRLSQRMLKIGFLRRRYVKRLVRYIDKSKAKGRDVPPSLEEVARFLAAVPKAQRAERLEEAIVAQQSEEPFNRVLRRAAANQQRRSGKGAGGYRPGAPPRSLVPGPRPSKKPR